MTMVEESRPVWGEGMMLAPQHFQQLERWVSGESRERGRGLASFPWGFTTWELDDDALAGGELVVRRCAGYFTDGTSFRCPERDLLPSPVSVAAHLDADQEQATAYLAMPLDIAGAASFAAERDATPWVLAQVEAADDGRPESKRGVNVARANLSVRFEREGLDGYRTLPLARLQRREVGGVELVPSFIPPALTLQAAPMATGVLRQVTGIMTQKWADLASQDSGGRGSGELAGLLLMSLVGGSLPVLRHLLQTGSASPELAYLELARLAAQLCTFHTECRATEIPAYDHVDPGAAFSGVAAMLRELLGDAAPTRCAQIPLDRNGESLFSAVIPSQEMLEGSSLFLGVRADAPEDMIQSRFGAIAKITSKDRIQELLMRAVAGISVRHVPQPPASISARAGRTYFVLETGGEHWDAIVASLTLSIHVAPELRELELELLSVKE